MHATHIAPHAADSVANALATLAGRALAPHAVSETPHVPTVCLDDLSWAERTVALYASDMPDRYEWDHGETPRVCAWIIQGAERLGRAELSRSASYFWGNRLLWMSRLRTQANIDAYKARFPSEKRLDRAEEVIGLLRFTLPRPKQIKKNAAEVEGGCPCRGTCWITIRVGGGELLDRSCPVHEPAPWQRPGFVHVRPEVGQ